MNCCRCIKSGSGMAIQTKRNRGGVSMPLIRRKYAGMGTTQLLEGNIQKNVYEPTIIADPNNYKIDGSGLRLSLIHI